MSVFLSSYSGTQAASPGVRPQSTNQLAAIIAKSERSNLQSSFESPASANWQSPLAMVSTQVSLKADRVMLLCPPNMVIRLVPAFKMTLCTARSGAGAVGLSCVQLGVPPNPLALAMTQTSLLVGPESSVSTPPNTIIRLVVGLPTALWRTLTGGEPPVGLSSIHV